MNTASGPRGRTFLWLLAAPVAFAAGAWFAAGWPSPPPLLPPATTNVTVVAPTPSVLVAVRDLARLETAEFHMERVIDLREKQTRWFGLVDAEDSLLLVASGEVVAGVDLSQLRTDDVVVDAERGAATLVLARPTVFFTHLDAKRTFVHSRKTDLLATRVEALEGRARAEAERSLRVGAEQAGILDKAEANARRTVTTLVRSLGYDAVTIRFRDPSGDERAVR